MGFDIDCNYLPLPREIVEKTLDLSLGEFRLLCYLLYYQIHFAGRTEMKLSNDDLIRGCVLADGSKTDGGACFKCNRDIQAAREALVARGWLEVTPSGEGTVYRLVIKKAPSVYDTSTFEERQRWMQNASPSTPANAKCIPQGMQNALTSQVTEKQEDRSISSISREIVGESGDAKCIDPKERKKESTKERKREESIYISSTPLSTSSGNPAPTPSASGEDSSSPSASKNPRKSSNEEKGVEGSSSPKEHTEQLQKSKPNRKPSDPRFNEFQQVIQGLHEHMRGEVPYWTGREGKILADFLRRKSTLTAEHFRKWLRNYWASENINPADPLHKYLYRLESYSDGPLNEYGKPKNGVVKHVESSEMDWGLRETRRQLGTLHE